MLGSSTMMPTTQNTPSESRKNYTGAQGASHRQQLPAVVPRNRDIKKLARSDRCIEPHRRELWRAADAVEFGQHAAPRTHFPIKMTPKCRGALLAQPARPFL